MASLEDGVAFTLVATAAEVAVLDAIQYLVGGPCVEATEAEQVLDYEPDVSVDEDRWHTFARATAAKGVASTLTLPILSRGRVVGTVNLYAASARAFAGLHREIADIFGAWAPGAVTNADLSFRTRRTAEKAPATMRAAMRVDIAIGILMERASVDADQARALLNYAARRAGVTVELLADTVVEIHDAPREVTPGEAPAIAAMTGLGRGCVSVCRPVRSQPPPSAVDLAVVAHDDWVVEAPRRRL